MDNKDETVTPSPDFSLDAVVQRYTGATLLARLFFVAARVPALRAPALAHIVAHAQQLGHTQAYRRAHEQARAWDVPLPALDQAWLDEAEKRAQGEYEALENELNAYKQNLIRKKIRTGHNALGAHHEARGDYNAALRAYIRTQDYCSSSEHMLELCLHVLRVSLLLGNFAHVLNYVAKAEQQSNVADKRGVVAVLRACAGLAHLENRKYKTAARKFLEASALMAEAGGSHELLQGVLVAPQDLATYAALTALAELTRAELHNELLDHAACKRALSQVPRVQAVLEDFYASRYAQCLAVLEGVKQDLLLDIHMHDHIGALYDRIRSKALVQYFSPYVAVDMSKMANAFQTSVTALEGELAKLIAEGVISARIDSHNKRLVARHARARASTFAQVNEVGDAYQKHTRAMLLRVQLVRANMLVKPGKGKERRGGRPDRRK